MPTLTEIFAGKSPLPDKLPEDPFPILVGWFEEAMCRRDTPNPNAAALATATADGKPSVRMVLCKGIDAARGYLTFYSNRTSRKGRELAANPRAAMVFHWDVQERQVRVEGRVVESPEEESDAYFRSRAWQSRLGAWASQQSEPIESRKALLERVMGTVRELGLSLPGILVKGDKVEIPRPPFWGGYRLWASSVECWASGTGRVHDRARWERELTPSVDGFEAGAWSVTRLQP